jgi:hypothetical protein
MPRNRVPVFITPVELCALLADEAPKHAADVYCRVERPLARLAKVALHELAEVVAHEQVRELHLTLPGAGPDHDQDWHFQQRNRKLIVTIELGRASEAVELTTISTDPDGAGLVVLRDFERAVSRLCHHYVRIPDSGRLQKVYWSPALAGGNLVGCEPVPDDVAKVERAAAAAKRKPKWKLR